MTSSQSLPIPSERVLSTLNTDGSRHWLRPRLSPGRFLTARRITAWVLIALFTVLPFVNIGRAPAILLDIERRQFTLFGKTFLPTDTIILAVFVVGIVVAVFLLTAVLGRVWCGWGCPQTVYMEFLYRPIERFFDGPPVRGGKIGRKATPLRTIGKYLAFLLASMALAHTFLSYFVGVDNLRLWITRSPFNHPTSFAVMLATTALMFFDFAWFREQTCIVACPYGRLQSVLLDSNSLIVSYDPVRGEPRGHGHGAHVRLNPSSSEQVGGKGDCVDCGLCVDTCPTGIDIRGGLRMECIGCAQCIDACDAVMNKLKRPLGLVRYSSQLRISGEKGRIARPRLFVYTGVLLLITAVLATLVAQAKDLDVTLLRGMGVPFTKLPSGEIGNPARLKITNRSREPRSYRVEVATGGPVHLLLEQQAIMLQPSASVTRGLVMAAPPSAFIFGKHKVVLRVVDNKQSSSEVTYEMLGPYHAAGRASLEASVGASR